MERVAGLPPVASAPGPRYGRLATGDVGRLCASFQGIMALNNALIALTCAVAFPVAALAQSPASAPDVKAGCCATAAHDGAALARSVLLPPDVALSVDHGATALAASVLLPAPSADCCAVAPEAHEHAAHAGGGTAAHGSGCCQGMKDGEHRCEMACCQSAPPTR